MRKPTRKPMTAPIVFRQRSWTPADLVIITIIMMAQAFLFAHIVSAVSEGRIP